MSIDAAIAGNEITRRSGSCSSVILRDVSFWESRHKDIPYNRFLKRFAFEYGFAAWIPKIRDFEYDTKTINWINILQCYAG